MPCVEELEHRGRSDRSEVVSASRVTIASSSEDSLERGADAGVDRGAEPAVDGWRDDRQVHVLGVLANHLGGAVGGAVVDDDHARAEPRATGARSSSSRGMFSASL